MIVKLLTEHHLQFLSSKGGCRGSSESTHVKMSHCWKSHAMPYCTFFSLEGKEILECMIESSRECPQFWLVPNSTDISYQRDLILSMSPTNSKYDVACERHTGT